jgi:prepilin-type N-terminal cleavage/methylation domain-containing protein
MKRGNVKHTRGLTLIEIMIVVLIITVAILGAMSFRFFATVDAKKADVHINATRIASMLLENWKGLGGNSTYNPTTQFGTLFGSQYTINATTSSSAPSAALSSKLASCQIQDLTNKVYYYVTLSYTTATATAPEALNASISWNQKYSTTGTTEKTISITTYAD